MKKIDEAKLVKIEVYNDGDTWTMLWKNGQYVHRGTVDSFAKLLMTLKAADDRTDPKSNRSMTYMNIAKEIQFGNDRIIWVFEHMLKRLYKESKMRNTWSEKAKAETAKCPDCGNKYLVQTGYCVSCKKKVADPKSEKKKEEIEVMEDFRLPGTGIILEVGDRITVYRGEEEMRRVYKEEKDPKVTKIIKDLAKSYGGSNEDQGKMVQLFRGLAFSDDPEANKFMVELDKWTTEYANKVGD